MMQPNEIILNRWLSIVGRIAIVYLFCLAAIFHLTFGFDATVKDMAEHGVPFPTALDVVAMVISSACALGLLFNFKPVWSARGLAAYVLCVSTVMYGPFNAHWADTRVFFMKDMAIFGALLAWSCTLATAKITAGAGVTNPGQREIA